VSGKEIMQILDTKKTAQLNRDSYDGLIVSIEAGQGDLNLLLAVCDDKNYRDRLIEDYEKELKKMGIRPYRLSINAQDPSLYDALSRLCRSEDYLKQKGQVVLTVMGATNLLPLNLGEARSQLEIFADYLQYTREGLRDFPFPVVLWLTNAIHDYIAEKAMDFYSWRKGVFFFVAESIPKEDTPIREITAFEMQPQLSFADIEERGVGMLKVEDLQNLIAQKKGEPDESLATLYSSLGKSYEQRLDSGKTTSYQADLQAAIIAYQKAVELQEELKSDLALATSLNNLAKLYYTQGRYDLAESLYRRLLVIDKKVYGENHPHVATSLNNLASLYKSQGKYKEAEPLHLRSLSIREKQLGENHPHVAISLNNLASLYESQGKYKEAEPLHLRSLSIREKQLGADHPDVATSLNNLATLYYTQGCYPEAEPLFLRSLSIRKKQLGEDHPDVASSLNNLATLYYTQGRYPEAEPLYLRSRTIYEKQLGADHPHVAQSLNNLAMLYNAQGNYGEAKTLSQGALTIFQKTLGDDHPQTQNSLFATKMLNVQVLLDCDTETLYGLLQTLAQQEKLSNPDTETNLMLLERIATNPQLLQSLEQAL
jgi:tetratricopeptide (TPR) repeat protein